MHSLYGYSNSNPNFLLYAIVGNLKPDGIQVKKKNKKKTSSHFILIFQFKTKKKNVLFIISADLSLQKRCALLREYKNRMETERKTRKSAFPIIRLHYYLIHFPPPSFPLFFHSLLFFFIVIYSPHLFLVCHEKTPSQLYLLVRVSTPGRRGSRRLAANF